MTTGDRDRERRLDEALRGLAQVEAPGGLGSRVEAALDAREATAAGAGAVVRLRARPAHLALLAATVALCVAGWWSTRPAQLPSRAVAGASIPMISPVLPETAVLEIAGMPPSQATRAAARAAGPGAAAAPTPALPAQPSPALSADGDHSLPPLPDPPVQEFEDVAPAPLVMAQLDEPAPIEIEPLQFPIDTPDDTGAGDSRW